MTFTIGSLLTSLAFLGWVRNGILKWRQKKTSQPHRTTLTTPSRGKSGPDISTPSVAQIFVLAKFSHD